MEFGADLQSFPSLLSGRNQRKDIFYEGATGVAASPLPHQEDAMEQKDIDYFHDLLAKMLEEALEKGEETLETMTDSVEVFADPADRATMESDRTFTLRLRDRERKLIKKIQDALQRIEDGTFGVCEECGEDVSVARLKARPVTKLCINCKSRQEDEENLRGE